VTNLRLLAARWRDDRDLRGSCLVLAGLALLVGAVYGRVLGHDFLFNWDDNAYVSENPAVWGFSRDGVRAVFGSYYVGNYAPVQMLSYMLDYTLWGLRPAGFLLSNVLLHLANGILCYRLLWGFYRDRLISSVAAALFLFHPVQVESVAWISQRKNLLAMLFFLGSWLLYCRYREAPAGKRGGPYAASLGLFVLALLSKSVAVVLPLVLVCYDAAFPLAAGRPRVKDKLPFLAAALVVALVALHSQDPGHGGGRALQGWPGGSPWGTFCTMLVVCCRYLGMLACPSGLSGSYTPTLHGGVDAAVAGAALLLGCLLWCGVLLYRRDRRLAFWAALFFIGLLPVAQFVPLITLMNDRYLYFPLLGAAALAGCAAAGLRDGLARHRPALLALALLVPLAGLALVSWQRVGVWRDALTFWSDTAARTPAAPGAWAALAEAQQRAGGLVEARGSYRRALALDPNHSAALNGLGNLLTRDGEEERGFELLQRLVQVNPGHVKGWANLGHNCLRRRDLPGARQAYRRALALQPGSWQLLCYLGNLELITRDFEAARGYYLKAEAAGPGNPETAYQLACVAALAGSKGEALSWLETALQRGYADLEAVRGGADLASLRDEPRFAALLSSYSNGR
jgi:protein O-mannosyl-transferase